MSISNYLSFCKIDHPKFVEFCISWRRDSIFRLVYLQEFLMDLSESKIIYTVEQKTIV